MSTEFQNDELCRLWQALERPRSNEEVRSVMEMVEKQVIQLDRKVLRRNVREYAAAALVAVAFAAMASAADTLLAQIGNATVSAAGVWIILFLWWMHRSTPAPLPEASSDAYRNALLAKYDRQIFLTRTAWAWYVLPFTTGLVLASLGNDHNPKFGFVMAGFMAAVGVVIAMLNRRTAKMLAEEKHELERLLQGE